MMPPGKMVRRLARSSATGLLALALLGGACAGEARQEGQPASGAGRAVGTVKAVGSSAITLATDAGSEITVQILGTTRMVQTAPGQRDLTGSTLIALPQVQVGDRVLVRGNAAADGKSIAATSLVVMKQADIKQKQQREMEDWQKRGVGGLVGTVDAAAGSITLTTSGLGGNRSVTVRVAKETIIRRYAPDSVKFDDATRGTLDQIKPGDQLRARGERNAEGGELAAEEVVSGSFRNISGVISAVDVAQGTISLTDLATKKPVVVKITSDSQMRKLPAPTAQVIAFRLRGPAAESEVVAAPRRPPEGQPASPAGAGPGPRGGRGGGDLQQMLSRVPAATIADLQKGDAVMMVTTPGSATSNMTVITLLSGVDAILTAPNRQVATLLSPWNLGAGGESEP